jgi:hypothetical protein
MQREKKKWVASLFTVVWQPPFLFDNTRASYVRNPGAKGRGALQRAGSKALKVYSFYCPGSVKLFDCLYILSLTVKS